MHLFSADSALEISEFPLTSGQWSGAFCTLLEQTLRDQYPVVFLCPPCRYQTFYYILEALFSPCVCTWVIMFLWDKGVTPVGAGCELKGSWVICFLPNIILWPLLWLVSSQHGLVVNLFNPSVDDLVTFALQYCERGPLIVNGQKCVPEGTVL